MLHELYSAAYYYVTLNFKGHVCTTVFREHQAFLLSHFLGILKHVSAFCHSHFTDLHFFPNVNVAHAIHSFVLTKILFVCLLLRQQESSLNPLSGPLSRESHLY